MTPSQAGQAGGTFGTTARREDSPSGHPGGTVRCSSQSLEGIKGVRMEHSASRLYAGLGLGSMPQDLLCGSPGGGGARKFCKIRHLIGTRQGPAQEIQEAEPQTRTLVLWAVGLAVGLAGGRAVGRNGGYAGGWRACENPNVWRAAPQPGKGESNEFAWPESLSLG